MGLWIGEETEEGYRPSMIFQLLRPKTSGNILNGVGDAEDRPATPVYHRLDRWGPWLWVNLIFIVKQFWDAGPRGQFWDLLKDFRGKNAERSRRHAVANTHKTGDAADWMTRLQEQVHTHSLCDEIGVAAVHRALYFDGDVPTDTKRPRYAIVLLRKMDYDEMSATLQDEDWKRVWFWKRKWVRSVREVMKTYADVHESALRLAAWIRAQGYPAEGVGGAPGSKLNILRTAIEAGLGELGKHGSIINKTHGSTVRFAVVLTDLPLQVSTPANFGAEDFCVRCRICEDACPPKAISREKTLVRGVEKWYVDFDRCVPYFNDTNGCGVCISACPWSRPGIAETLAKKMARRRRRTQ